MSTRAIPIERDKPTWYKGKSHPIGCVSSIPKYQQVQSGYAKQYKKNEKH